MAADGGTLKPNPLTTAIRGAGGGGSGSSRTPVEAPDSLNSIATAHLLDLWGEGEMAGWYSDHPLKDVALDETPVMNEDGTLNFTNVYMDWREGTNDQSYMKGFPSVSNEVTAGVELKQTTPWTHTINNIQLSAVRVRISVAALSKTNASNGDINGHSVSYAIDLKVDSGAFVEVLVNAITGKTNTKYERMHRIDLPPAMSNWTIRVRRLTADTESAGIQDTTFIESYTEIMDLKMRYPNSAYCGLRMDAAQFRSIPSRAYRRLGRLMRVPSNYDPVAGTYDGIWDGTFMLAWTRNPAWIFYDLVTNERFGLGQYVDESQIDKWALYQIAQYCDELVPDGKGGTEHRFTSTVYLQNQQEAYKVLQDLASIFRGMSYWGSGAIIPTCDMPRDVSYIYNNTNVKDGKFSYQGSARRARHTVALVSWSDPTFFNRQKIEYVEDEEAIARYGVQTVQITAVGCTSQGQAQRVGRWILLTEKMETDTVTFAVGLDGGMLSLPGQIIGVADEKRAGRRIGGRVSSATASVVNLDQAPIAAIGDDLFCIMPNGTAEKRPISSIVGNAITVDPAYSAAPVAESVWAIESPTLKTQLFSVISIGEGEGLTAVITALQHEPGKHEAVDNGTKIEERVTTSLLPAVQAPPTNVVITAEPRAGQVVAGVVVTATWTAAPGAINYDVQWRRSNGEWSPPQRVLGTEAELFNAFAGEYVAKVSANNGRGIVSIPAVSETYIVDDPTMTPGFVGDLTASIAEALETAENAQATADGVIEFFWQPTAPVIGTAEGQAKEGDIWYDTNDGNHAWRVSGGVFVDAQDDAIAAAHAAAVNAQGTADGKTKLFVGFVAPVSGYQLHDQWFDKTNYVLRTWNGSTWEIMVDNSALANPEWIKNGGFELGLGVGWGDVFGTGIGGWFIEAGGFTGSNRLVKFGGAGGSSGIYQAPGAGGLMMPVSGGQRLSLTYAVQKIAIGGSSLTVGVVYYDAAGAYLDGTTYGFGSPTTLTEASFASGIWKTHRNVLTAPANAASCRVAIAVHNYATGAWLIDSVAIAPELQSIDELPNGAIQSSVLANQVQFGVLPPYSFGDELAINGSFENVLAGGGAPSSTVGKVMADGWEIVETGGILPPIALLEVDNTGPAGGYIRNGIRNLCFQNGTGNISPGNNYTIVGMKQTFSVQPGEAFLVKFAAREDFAVAWPANTVGDIVIGLRFYTSTGVYAGQITPYQTGPSVRSGLSRMSPSQGRYERVAIAPANAAFARVIAYLNCINNTGANINLPWGVCHMRFDDLSIKRITTSATAPNMLKNASFVQGVTNWAGLNSAAEFPDSKRGVATAPGAGVPCFIYQEINYGMLGVGQSYSGQVEVVALGHNDNSYVAFYIETWDAVNGYVTIGSHVMYGPELATNPSGLHKLQISGAEVTKAGITKVRFMVVGYGPMTTLQIRKPKLERGLLNTSWVGDVVDEYGSELTFRGSRRLLGGPRNIPVGQTMGAGSVRTTGSLSANSSGQCSVLAHSVELNGETVPYNAVTNAVVGLTQNVTYVIYCFDPFAEGGTRTWFAASTILAAQQAGEGVVIAGNITIPTSGSSGGGGGGGGDPDEWCVDYDSVLPDGRLVRDLQPGDMVECVDVRQLHPTPEMHEVKHISIGMEDCYRLTTDGLVSVVQSASTPMDLVGGGFRRTAHMMGQVVIVKRGGFLERHIVSDLQWLGLRKVVKIDLGDRMFFAGETAHATIATHNIRYKP